MVNLHHRTHRTLRTPSWPATVPSNRGSCFTKSDRVDVQSVSGPWTPSFLNTQDSVSSTSKWTENITCSSARVPTVLDMGGCNGVKRAFPKIVLSLSSQGGVCRVHVKPEQAVPVLSYFPLPVSALPLRIGSDPRISLARTAVVRPNGHAFQGSICFWEMGDIAKYLLEGWSRTDGVLARISFQISSCEPSSAPSRLHNQEELGNQREQQLK